MKFQRLASAPPNRKAYSKSPNVLRYFSFVFPWQILSPPERKMRSWIRWRSKWYQQKKGYHNDCIYMQLGSGVLFKMRSGKEAIQWPLAPNPATAPSWESHKTNIKVISRCQRHACMQMADASQHMIYTCMFVTGMLREGLWLVWMCFTVILIVNLKREYVFRSLICFGLFG